MTPWEQRVSRLLRALRLDSIRRELLVFVLLATLIPSFTTAWISYLQNKRSLTEKITGELQSESAQTAREMDLWVKERLYELRVFASSYEVTENLDRVARGADPRARARLTDYLRSVRDRFADYQELLVVNPRGEAVASTASPPAPLSLPPNWEKVIRADNAVIGDAYRDAALGKSVVVFAVPTYQTGERFLGAMTAKVDLAAVQRLLRRFAGWESGRVSLITTSGSPIVASRSPAAEPARPTVNATTVRRLLEREGATLEYLGLDGQASVGVAKRVPRLEWAVLAEVPAAEAYRQVTRLRDVTALIVVALFAGVGLLAYFLGLLITRPLDRLTRGAAKVAEGDLEVDLPVLSGGELGYVTEVFNDMVARLREGRRELERLSITDHLTGLYNRRYLMDALASEVRRSHRLKHRCALLMADVDHFKAYNDAFGHLAGDEALTRVAAILRQATRDVDCAARYGGEEFVVLMPETEAGGGAAQTAQRIRERLAADSLVGSKLTLSIGIAQFPDDADTPEALLGVADAALYQAKREGRDRVQRASD
ncbi:MAG TPA: diguanylate cyclase [Gemmatimonadales bacterium]|nr:diguanylate cyclase [Gemmatimonadales bacterium]